MPPLTLNQAAKAAKRSKATLLEAINSGRMSAPRDEQGRYQIDPAELFRVYPLTSPEPATETDSDPAPELVETAAYREKTALLERIIATLEDERDDLRARLDKSEAARETAAAEIHRLTLMLTYQPERQEPTPAPTPEATTPAALPAPSDRYAVMVRPAFWWALAFAASASAAAWWLAPWTNATK
jgi:hypothetical protein